jgi:hypothetical protein
MTDCVETTAIGDGFAAAALFDHPTAVTVDHRGFIYVTDSRNGRIRRIAPVGIYDLILAFITQIAFVSLWFLWYYATIAALLNDSVPQMSVFPSELVMLIGHYLSSEGLVTTITSDWERSLPGAAAALGSISLPSFHCLLTIASVDQNACVCVCVPIAILSPSYGDSEQIQSAYISPFDGTYDWAPESSAIDITDRDIYSDRNRTRPVAAAAKVATTTTGATTGVSYPALGMITTTTAPPAGGYLALTGPAPTPTAAIATTAVPTAILRIDYAP